MFCFIYFQAAHQNGEPEILLNSRYSTYTINLHAMTQISEDYITSWAIRRRVNPAAVLNNSQDGAPSLANNYFVIVTEPNNGNSVQNNSRYCFIYMLIFPFLENN